MVAELLADAIQKAAPASFDKKEWRTPAPVFRPWWEKWRFTIDAFAADRNSAGVPDFLVGPHNARCIYEDLGPGHWCRACDRAIGRYFTKEDTGLDPSKYRRGDVVWANPPYNEIIEPALKLAKDLALDGGIPWVLLLPPSIDAVWFHKHLWNDRASRWRDGVQGIFPPGRIRFNRPDGTPGESPRAGNLYAVLYAGGDK